MEWIRSRIARHPKLAIVLGKALLIAGSILILGAVFARAGLISINADRAEASQPPLRTLAEAESVLAGPKGNRERFLLLQAPDTGAR